MNIKYTAATDKGLLTILSLGEAENDSSFLDAWNTGAAPADIQYQLNYLTLEATHQPGEVTLAIFDHMNGKLFKPVVIRPVNSAAGSYHDLITPFEYGGPLILAEPEKLNSVISDFQSAFDGFCRDYNIVSEFVRFHPILEIQRGWEKIFSVDRAGQNVVMELDRPMKELRRGYARGQRRNLSLARDNGAAAQRVPVNAETVSEFRALYLENLDRLNAIKFCQFSETYFDKLSDFGDEGFSLYIMNTPDFGCVSALLVVHGERIAHSHLIGARADVRALFPQTMIYDAAAEDLMARGRTIFHLGGAANDQAGTRFFKEGFSKSRAAYFIGRRVCDQPAYDRLSALHIANAPEIDADYFPAYRAPIRTESKRQPNGDAAARRRQLDRIGIQ